MTGNADSGPRILGSLRADGGTGAVRIEDRIGTGIGELWSALTDPSRLGRWYGRVEGDLRPGGEYRAYVFASGWEGTGRVDACEPPRRLMVTGKDPGEPFEEVLEVTLTADGDQTILVLDQRGLSLGKLSAYAAGLQVHAEDLAAYIDGRERCDFDARWSELHPAYQELAAGVGG
jgi:uncharacterized protein YndB with AHSA1/START domain